MSVSASGELAYEGGEVRLTKENDCPAETSFLYDVNAVPRTTWEIVPVNLFFHIRSSQPALLARKEIELAADHCAISGPL
ncbi:hypothetical protein M513_06397 [Trichuris suis]|uniref:Uncharacterized protein n=1 Tax=Trichuris suis TaxID=68888 RepID=A0A085M695_9BILA|nr:hypothetical protein M513_06397 [Trichuris suis]